MSYVLIFDSGSGGEYVLNLCKALLPHEKFIFYKDEAHCPYGNKSYDTLKSIFFSTLIKLKRKFDIKAIVVACNTMSSMFGEELKRRKLFTKTFLVTPRINSQILSKPTLLLATENTCKFNKKIVENKGNKNLFLLPLPSFALEIDKNRDNLCILQKDIEKFLLPYKNKGIKNVVLGCTHYNYITPFILETLGEVSFFENSLNVVLKLKKYLQKNLLLSTNKETFCLTSIKE